MVNIMKNEYDFSQGERGKFYHPNAEFNLPIYLEPDISEFIKKLATVKQTDMSSMVNSLLKSNKELIESLQYTS
ncbi:hypothetical protein THIOM_005447 [Candidatus Thiomargarita nelsonii]|uniref:Uncharacterized protein n=1 Tax=Candidatus Thiomargarita nelsonii TaxID=1003181 RepID=A0A176RT76_9GAMM|nr:hypothetical protein THIOM_005447 [Candidatus Thiomargarita nelsonii]